MPGLSFSGNQSQSKRPGLWWIPVVLIVISIALITLCVRFENAGPFAYARTAVHTVSKPIEMLCSGLSAPCDAIRGAGQDEQVAALKKENEQLRTLVAELEEYRQQDQRLTTLVQLADTYGLETVSAEVVGTTTGWNRTSTINKGSNDGIQVGMGVMSSCGLYGQVESVTATTATIRLVNDANSSVSAMVQSSRARGILNGAYDGTLTLEYVPVDKPIGEGDIVISSGQGGTYPRGLVIGRVRSIETDSSKLYYRISVEPIYGIDSCEEVMVLTGNESETTQVLDKALLESITSASSAAVAASAAQQQADQTQGSTSMQTESVTTDINGNPVTTGVVSSEPAQDTEAAAAANSGEGEAQSDQGSSDTASEGSDE